MLNEDNKYTYCLQKNAAIVLRGSIVATNQLVFCPQTWRLARNVDGVVMGIKR